MFFSKKSYPELISLHIPKTAGTSFRNILKVVYGDNQVVRFDINEKGIIKMNEDLYSKKQLPSVKVIHGHFSLESLKEKFSLPENYKLITWMRDPVKRVISNFYYLDSRRKEFQKDDRNDLSALANMPLSLIDYARIGFNQNKQAKFLAGSRLSDFDFVGINEYFEEELHRLGATLKWKKIPDSLYHNKTVNLEKKIPEELLQEIAILNKEDIELYNEAFQIRKSMLKSK